MTAVMVALQSYFSNPSLLSALLQVKMKREMQTWGWETAQMLVPNCPNRLQVVHFECPGPWKPWISSNKAVIAFLVLLFYSIAMLPLLFTMTAVMVALQSYPSNPSLSSALLEVKMKKDMQIWNSGNSTNFGTKLAYRMQMVQFECYGP